MSEVYPPKGDPLHKASRCLFYQDRICIEFITIDEDKPCEVCDIVVMWWKERKKLLSTEEGRKKLRAEWKKWKEEEKLDDSA